MIILYHSIVQTSVLHSGVANFNTHTKNYLKIYCLAAVHNTLYTFYYWGESCIRNKAYLETVVGPALSRFCSSILYSDRSRELQHARGTLKDVAISVCALHSLDHAILQCRYKINVIIIVLRIITGLLLGDITYKLQYSLSKTTKQKGIVRVLFTFRESWTK